jgi:CheY-like chemotaxis protein/anti-sigma regulatory factor (Ser/Thr protein kinase)
MPKVLVVDDSPVDRRLAGSFLESRIEDGGGKVPTGISVVYAVDGKEGLAAVGRERPDLVVTDLQMPQMSGLELVEAVKNQYATVPVIIMTAHGSEDIARQALQGGAASYVPKRDLAKELLATVEEILSVSAAQEERQRFLDDCLRQSEAQYLLPNKLSCIAPLIGHLQESLTRMKLCDENGLIRVAVCLREALTNAIIHGNLEVDSALRETDEKGYYKLIEERAEEEPYDGRYVHVIARESCEEAAYTIRDEGAGFDFQSLPDPTDPANLERVSGRGMLLIQTFMDEVKHNAQGNEITMVKRRDAS